MKRSFNLIKVMSVVVLCAACAQKPNSRPSANNGQQATGDAKDTLKNLAAPQILAAKYKSLSASCTLSSRPHSTTADQAPSVTADDSPSSIAVPQPVVKDQTLTYDLKEQVKSDLGLQNSVNGTIVSADQKTSVVLTIAPVEFKETNNMKNGKLVYLRKHSPVLAISAKLQQTNSSDAKQELPAVAINLNESLPLSTVLTTITAQDKSSTDVVLDCTLAGEIAKDDFKDQNVDINCAQPPTEEQKALYKANCPTTDVPVSQ